MCKGHQLLRACAPFLVCLFQQPVHAQALAPELRHLNVAGHARVYTVEMLGQAVSGNLRPIVVELHGVGTDVRHNGKNRFLPNFSIVANIDPVLIVRPQGANRTWDRIPGSVDDWRRLSGADGVPVDDIAFLRAVIADVAAKDGGDPKRAFLYGISAGGYMSARIACEMAGDFRAVATLIATARADQLAECATAKPIPYLLLASKADPVNPYAGLKLAGRDSLAGAEEVVSYFVHRNGCRNVEERAVPHADQSDRTTATIILHTECAADAEVVFYRLDGAGHTLPSRVSYESDRDHKINRDLETAQELWNFFKRHMSN
jgi:polyhydroxybutyrate depolymerase